MNITLTGNLGSGKSSICKILKAKGFGIVSGGDLFRGVAAEKGLTVIEMNELAKKDRSIDDLIDQRSTRLGDELDHTVFDSRLAWNFVRESFKVFLLVDTDEAARRVFEGDKRQSEEYASAAEAAEGLAQRAFLETERFKTLYNIDYYDKNNYDLVIESTNATPKQIAEELLRQFARYQKCKFTDTVLDLNLKAMYPAEEVSVPEVIGQEKKQTNEEEAFSLCMSESLSVLSCGGYNLLTEDAPKAAKALADGKIFAEVKSFTKGSEAMLDGVSRKVLSNLEEAGNFRYRSYPENGTIKHDYMMDLSR